MIRFIVRNVMTRRKPFALLNIYEKKMRDMNAIIADESAGAMQAIDYLLSLGHRRILFVGHRWSKDDDV